MNILVTGFDPFNKETINPALEAVKQLPDTILGATIIKLEIPTVFLESAKEVQKAIQLYQPDIVLHIGQAGGRSQITIERVAINIDDASIPDNWGQQPIDQPIQNNGQPAYFSQLPIKAVVKGIKSAGIPASISNSAGTFVCNHIMYQTHYFIDKQQLPIKAGFIHVPFIPEQVVTKPTMPSMSLEHIIKGISSGIEQIILFHNQSDLAMEGGTLH